jgi:hypothetical protein
MTTMTLDSWQRQTTDQGYRLSARDRVDACVIDVRFEVRPLIRIAEHVAELERALERYGAASIDVRRIATVRGELGAIVAAHAGEHMFHRGVVIADDWYACFDGIGTASDELREAVETLTHEHDLGLGYDRLRAYR